MLKFQLNYQSEIDWDELNYQSKIDWDEIGNWPTRIDPIGFPVTLTATKDRAAMIKPVIATPSWETQ